MTKHIMILTILLSIVEGTLAQENPKLIVTKEDKEIVILMAKPQDKLILKDFLKAPDMTKADALKIKEILKQMIVESESSQPMMTKTSQGE